MKVVKRKFEFRRIEYEVDPKNKKMHGYFKEWNLQGQLIRLCNYRNDLKHGNCKVFIDNRLAVDKNFKNGKHHGTFIIYFVNGKMSIKQMYENGKLNGPSIHYYTNGNISSEHCFREGILNGMCKEYYPSNRKKIKCLYVNGKLWGPHFYWIQDYEIYRNNTYNDIVICETKFYINGKIDQRWKLN